MISQKLAGQLLKGLYSAVVAFLGSLSAILVGDTTFSQLTDGQWVTIAFTTVIAFGGTVGLSAWSGPNISPGPKP